MSDPTQYAGVVYYKLTGNMFEKQTYVKLPVTFTDIDFSSSRLEALIRHFCDLSRFHSFIDSNSTLFAGVDCSAVKNTNLNL